MFKKNILLSNHSNYKIGGLASHFLEAKKTDEIVKALKQWGKEKRGKSGRVFVLGAGTNVLFSDEGFDGLILKPKIEFIKNDDCVLRVGAGVPMEDLLDYAIVKSLSGLEWAGGLPGTVGGAVFGNAGAFGGEMKDAVCEVISMDISSPKFEIIKRTNKDCGFGYRKSAFKDNKGKEIIIEVVLSLEKGDKKSIKSAIEDKINWRKERQPLEYPNIGSIFKNVNVDGISKKNAENFSRVINKDPFPVVPAAYLISEAGLKGISCGGAMISPKHPNFIVNILNATANDVKNLINLAKNRVDDKFGIKLEEEIHYV